MERKDAIAAYYRNQFPATALHAFFAVAHKAGETLDRREWGIETVDGVFIRWQSCDCPEALLKLVTKPNMGKLNVGAVYDQDVVRHRRKVAVMRPVAREFVIDVDLDDYGYVDKDDLEGCDLNWPVVAIGLTTVRKVLAQCFGFRHFLIVYSGRRGGHLWVCDLRAREMNNEERSAVVAFLQKNMKGGVDSGGDVVHRNYDWVRNNPNLSSMVGKLVNFFESQGVAQVGMLNDVYQREQFLLAMGENISKRLMSVVRPKSGVQALRVIKSFIEGKCPESMRQYEDAVLTLVFPRLDINVSKDMGHMLKAPFSVHPKTGRVSVPLPHGCDATAWRPVDAPEVQRLRVREQSDVDALERAVETVNDMVTAMRKAEPAAVLLSHKRQRVVSFLGSSDNTLQAGILSAERRICWQLLRTFTVVRYACKKDEMIVEMTMGRSKIAFVHIIGVGQFPPFVHDERSTETRIDNLHKAVEACRHAPAGQLFHGESKHFIQIVKDKDEHKANDHFVRLMDDLEKRVIVARVQGVWGESIKTALRLQMSALLSREIQSF